MRVYALSEPLEQFILGNINFINNNSLLLIPLGLSGPIDLKDELDGKSKIIKELCIICRDKELCTVLCARADIKEKSFLTAFVIDRGRLLGTYDCTHDLNKKFSLGNALKVFDTSLGRLGILIGDDLYFFEAARIEALLDAELFIMFGDSKDYGVAPRASCDLNGRTGIFLTSNSCEIINADKVAKKENGYDIKIISDDRYLFARRRDIYRQLYSTLPY